MSRVGGQRPPLRDELGAAANVLLLAPTMDPPSQQGCGCLMGVTPPDETALLSVTLAEGPDERLAVWRDHVSSELPAKAVFVTAGDQIRSAAAADGGSAVTGPNGEVRIEAVSSPADLTGLGMKIGEVLEGFAGGDERIVFCFHSLTTLLQYVDLQKAFRFLHVVTGRLTTVNAMAHFHLDPAVHDDRQRDTLATLFDAVMAPGDDGWDLRTR